MSQPNHSCSSWQLHLSPLCFGTLPRVHLYERGTDVRTSTPPVRHEVGVVEVYRSGQRPYSIVSTDRRSSILYRALGFESGGEWRIQRFCPERSIGRTGTNGSGDCIARLPATNTSRFDIISLVTSSLKRKRTTVSFGFSTSFS